jgi:nitrogen regulatory protein P-II 1
MKKIEAVITPWTLDAFKDAVPRLGISEFSVVEIFRSGCATIGERERLHRGREFAADLSPRLRVEFVVFDDEVQSALHHLLDLVRPESISVFRLEQQTLTNLADGGPFEPLVSLDATNRKGGSGIETAKRRISSKRTS